MATAAKVLLALLAMSTFANAGKVLFFVPFASKSIKITFWPLAQEVAKRGHDVYVAMPFEEKSAKELKITVINVDTESRLERFMKEISTQELRVGAPGVAPIFDLMNFGLELSENAVKHPIMQDMLKDPVKNKFDLVLVSPFLATEVGYYLAHKFNASIAIYFTAQSSLPFITTAMGMQTNTAVSPMAILPYTTDMNLVQRVINTVITFVFEHVIRNIVILSKGEALVDKLFPEDIGNRPKLIELEKKAAVALQFGHPFIFDGFQPTSPNFVQIGMMNCRPPKEFAPGDKIGDFLNSSPNGVVYVSFGSVLQGSMMSEQRRRLFLNVFRRFPQYNFLWKWETEVMDDKPKNLMLSKWLPQQEVLGHPNMRVFVSHTGQSSFQEALCHQKPVLAIPVTGDQNANAREVEHMGFGLTVHYQELTEDKLYNAIDAMLHDPKYADKAVALGKLLTDQIEHPLQRATWWLEHIMRHPGMYEGRHAMHKMNWFQFNLVDVYAVIAAILFIILYTIKSIIVCCCCRRATKVKAD